MALPLEYQIYSIPKLVAEGGCDVKEHWKIVVDNDDEYMQNVLYCKSLQSKLPDNNCAIAIFTNILKIKVQPNKLREKLGL